MFQHFKSEINESVYPIEKFFDFLFSKKRVENKNEKKL